MVIVLRKPNRHAEASRGIARSLYPKRYLTSERSAWR